MVPREFLYLGLFYVCANFHTCWLKWPEGLLFSYCEIHTFLYGLIRVQSFWVFGHGKPPNMWFFWILIIIIIHSVFKRVFARALTPIKKRGIKNCGWGKESMREATLQLPYVNKFSSWTWDVSPFIVKSHLSICTLTASGSEYWTLIHFVMSQLMVIDRTSSNQICTSSTGCETSLTVSHSVQTAH